MVESRMGMQEQTHQADSKIVHGGKIHKHRGFTGVQAREILEHLFTNYGEILVQDLVENRVKMGE